MGSKISEFGLRLTEEGQVVKRKSPRVELRASVQTVWWQ